jgi:hypothetical protein
MLPSSVMHPSTTYLDRDMARSKWPPAFRHVAQFCIATATSECPEPST